MIQRRIKITGQVQGVFYRASAKQIADALDINGWIRNNADGSVLAYVSGEEKSVTKFIEWCWQGPQNAIVSNVSAEEYAVDNGKGFEIRR
ncbi:MAG: acylphosphatase [Chitinophagales bacterium]|nr:acylphosphatase [Chitinophagales bacterium]